MISRVSYSLIIGATLACSLVCACSRDDSAGHSARPPSSSEMPATVDVPAGEAVLGFAVGKLREKKTIEAFRVSRTPITVAQYRACMDAGGCTMPDRKTQRCDEGDSLLRKSTMTQEGVDDVPLTCATGAQAAQYCSWVRGSLPTAEQFLVSARGPAVHRYPWGDDRPSCEKSAGSQSDGQCCKENCDPKAHYRVGQRKAGASPFGLEDVLLTDAELLRSSESSSFPPCRSADRFCMAVGDGNSSIDSVAPYVDIQGPKAVGYYTVRTYGFRCVWTVGAQ